MPLSGVNTVSELCRNNNNMGALIISGPLNFCIYTFDAGVVIIGMLLNMQINESFQVFNFNFEFYTAFNHSYGFTATIQGSMHYSHTLYTGT